MDSSNHASCDEKQEGVGKETETQDKPQTQQNEPQTHCCHKLIQFDVFLSTELKEGLEAALALKKCIEKRGFSAFLCDVEKQNGDIPAQVIEAMVNAPVAIVLGTKTYGKKNKTALAGTNEQLRFIVRKKKPLCFFKMCDNFEVDETRLYIRMANIACVPWMVDKELKASKIEVPQTIADTIFEKLADMKVHSKPHQQQHHQRHLQPFGLMSKMLHHQQHERQEKKTKMASCASNVGSEDDNQKEIDIHKNKSFDNDCLCNKELRKGQREMARMKKLLREMPPMEQSLELLYMDHELEMLQLDKDADIVAVQNLMEKKRAAERQTGMKEGSCVFKQQRLAYELPIDAIAFMKECRAETTRIKRLAIKTRKVELLDDLGDLLKLNTSLHEVINLVIERKIVSGRGRVENLVLDTNSPTAFLVLCLLELGNLDVAMELCKLLVGNKAFVTRSAFNHAVVRMLIGIGSMREGLREKVMPSLVKAEKLLKGKSEKATASVNFIMGIVLFDFGDMVKSIKCNKKALKIRIKVYGMHHLETESILTTMASQCFDSGEYDLARVYWSKALDSRLAVCGDAHPEVAVLHNNIACTYDRKGDKTKALEYYHKALKIREAAIGPVHADTASLCGSIANAYREKGDFDKAFEYYNKTLEVQRVVLGEEDRNTSQTYNDMAIAYSKSKNRDRALECFTHVLKIREKLYGLEHEQTARVCFNIARVYLAKCKLDKAVEFFDRTQKIQEKTLGSLHLDTGRTCSNLAGAFYLQGNYSKALGFYNKALKIMRLNLGNKHPDVATAYNNIADVLCIQDSYDKALDFYSKALSILRANVGDKHPETAATYNGVADAFRRKGDHIAALEYDSKALQIHLGLLEGGSETPLKSVAFY
eukprot:m.8626 g.8626  ORF g.8626 m.8626 type:complete len:878 (-) comp6164_c0_seq1:65-2698(-)